MSKRKLPDLDQFEANKVNKVNSDSADMCEDFIGDEEDGEDDDLPVAFPLAKDEEKFKKGDLCFAQYPKYPFWPALFYSHMQKKKNGKQRAYVYFFDELSKIIEFNGKSKKKVIPVYVNNIKRFTCKERNELVEKGMVYKDYSNGIEQAEEYMRKRALGKIDDFFEYVFQEVPVSDGEEGDSREDVENPCKEISDKKILVNDKKKCMSLFEYSTSNTKMAVEIITWIKTFSRTILNDITNGSIESRRHQIFHTGTQKDKDKLRWYSGFGELNENSANEILNLLVSWFTKDFPGSDFKAVSYVSDVWLPEAYIHALSNIKNILPQVAEIEYLM